MQGSDLGSFYKPMSIGFIAIRNCAHFPDNLNLAAQFVSLVPILGVQGPYSIKKWVSIWSLFQSPKVFKKCLGRVDDKNCLCLSPVPTDQKCLATCLKCLVDMGIQYCPVMLGQYWFPICIRLRPKWNSILLEGNIVILP